MRVKEFCAMTAFQKVFTDLKCVEDYGVDNWLDLFNLVQREELDALYDGSGEMAEVVSDLKGGYLPELLTYEFYEVKCLLGEVVRNNVDLTTYKE